MNLFKPAPIAHAVLLLAAATAVQGARAQQAFSPAWFASKGATQNSAAATGYLPNGTPAAWLSNPAQQQQQANAQLQRSLDNLGMLARGIAAQQAAQEAARQAALANGGSVPDGLAEGGLKVDTNSLTRGWLNARAPTQSSGDGRTVVSIEQTADRAILNWESFNIGKNTILNFAQNANWAVLNRVNDPLARPSQIQGQITANGTVLIANRNGVVFSGSSQVDVRNLVAAAARISDAQFSNRGLYVDTSGTAPSFTDAAGNLVVQAGARITTRAPQSAIQDGGYVLLMGSEVNNAGRITTPSGQAVLAAGDSFTIRKGVGTDANTGSTTAGNEVSATRTSASGAVLNSGLIVASTGDITLTGHQVTQAGVLLSSSSTAKRGTIHLSTRASDGSGSVTVAAGSNTAIVVEDSTTTALDGQRDALIQASGVGRGNLVNGVFDNLSTVADRKDLSRIEIVSGSTVQFEGGSMTLATGGEIAVSAPIRSLVADGATLDVAGAVGVRLTMESNNLAINVQGNELRDAAVNRDAALLNNSTLWVDRRTLVRVPAGTNGYAGDRWYTAGGLLEVSGYLGTTGHTVGERMAQGGSITVTGGDFVTRRGSSINLSGGSLDVASGLIRQSWLKGADGRLYEVSRAPGDVLYDGLYRGFEETHVRWGSKTSEYFYNPLIAPQTRMETGYTVGRDAGRLIVATNNAVLEGRVVSETYQGPRQTKAAQADLDGYRQSHFSAARRAQLIAGQYLPVYDATLGGMRYTLKGLVEQVSLDNGNAVADSVALLDPVTASRHGKLILDSTALSKSGLGGLRLAATKEIKVNQTLQLADGGEVVLFAPLVDVAANLTAHAGSIRVGNVLLQVRDNGLIVDSVAQAGAGDKAGVTVHRGVRLDASGRVTDLTQPGGDQGMLAYLDGGLISIRSTDDVRLVSESLLDVSSGAAIIGNGKLSGGKGGSVQLGAGLAANGSPKVGATLTMEGDVRGYGVRGGGSLQVESSSAVVVGNLQLKAGDALQFDVALTEDYQVRAGEALPFAYALLTDHVPAGSIVTQDSGGPRIRDQNNQTIWYTLQADWTPPLITNQYGQFTLESADGTRYSYSFSDQASNPPIPKGTVLRLTNSMPTGWVVPKDVFPNGIEVVWQSMITLPAGSLAPAGGVLVPAGTRLTAGTVLARNAGVTGPTRIGADLFQSGFSRYEVRGYNGLIVADGTALDVRMPVLPTDAALWRDANARKQVPAALLPPLFQADPARRTVAQRLGADIVLAAGVGDTTGDVSGATGNISVGEGARVTVDPGRSMSFSSQGSLTVNGLLQANGGSISLFGPRRITTVSLEQGGIVGDGAGGSRAILLGEHAVLDASGLAYVVDDGSGHPYGRVSPGGSIIVGGTLLESASRALPSDAFVVLRKGASLQASGAAAMLDLDGRGAVPVASDGGNIQLVSANGLYLDGTMNAASGGAGASGGTLTVALEAPNYSSISNGVVANLRDLVLTQRAQGETTSLLPGQWKYGYASLGMNQVTDGGFSSLRLYSNGALSFAGDLSLSLTRELRLYSGGMGMADGVASGRVVLAAPYVLLAGITDNGAAMDFHTRPSYQGGVSTVPTTATLEVKGDLLDIKGAVTLGLQATSGVTAVNRAGFTQATLDSAGDLRFVKGARLRNGAFSDVELSSSGDIILKAGQIYPATGTSASVTAGRKLVSDLSPDGRLLIQRHDAQDGDPAVPDSLFGSITLAAAYVEQGGVVRAPLGSISLGTAGSRGRSRQVTLAPGSLTSVSAAGLLMPYGGTADGVNYLYQGNNIALKGINAGGSVQITGEQIAVESGARLDLSGGGDVRGAGFVSGRGGSSDARFSALMQVGANGFSLPSLSSNPVYAILPGYASAYAPANAEGAVDPRIGQQVHISSNQIPGLAAGVYTLLPSSYALLPGAFRVEINGDAKAPPAGIGVAMRNGSYAVSGQVGTANTSVLANVPSQLIVTPASVMRRYAQYNETSYSDFVLQQAVRNGTVRAALPADAKSLNLIFSSSNDQSLRFAGQADFTPGEGGRGGEVSMTSQYGGAIEILADGAVRSAGFIGLSAYASDLNRIGAARMVIGGSLLSTYGLASNGSNQSNIIEIDSVAQSVTLRNGAVLRAPEVFLVTGQSSGGIVIETGAGINTIGSGRAALGSDSGFIYKPGAVSLLAASNADLSVLPPEAASGGSGGGGAILIGGCGVVCSGTTELYSEGSLVAATRGDFQLDEAVRFGTRNLVLAVGSVNAGSQAELAAAAARGVLTSGLTLNQQILDRLLRGDRAYGAPVLERLELSAAESFNLFGSVDLSTLDPVTGQYRLANLVLSTPAIYGYGTASDLASISTAKLTWAGLSGNAPAPIAGGRGSGSGQLAIRADQIEFGVDPHGRPSGLGDFARTILGFSSVRMAANDRISANSKGSLAVYQSQLSGPGGPQYQGGNLTLEAPLLTGAPGSINRITAGGALQLVAPASGAASAAIAIAGTGAELSLSGNTVSIDTTVALPSGKLSVNSEGDIRLGNAAWLDLAGREIKLFDTSRYSWGGDVSLQSRSGNIVQAAGSVIDLAARNNNAGQLSAIALGGAVDLQGSLQGSSSGYYDAGGTVLPYRAGSVELRALVLGGGSLTAGFASLNNKLNAGGFLGERSFQFRQGDLVIGNELKGQQINVSLDAGQLLVNGLIDASGEQVGSIRLFAANGLTLAGSAILDAHGSKLRVDSYGHIIDSPNRAIVQLDGGNGTLSLQDGARIDLRHGTDANGGDGIARGTLDLFASRIGGAGSASDADAATFGDIAIDARGAVTIQGARTIAVYGRQRYSDAPFGSDPAASGRPYQVIDQAYLDGKHAEASLFIDHALGNANLLNNKLAGLNNASYRQAFRLRPAIEIVSATSQGDLVVQGDLDLSGLRYNSLNPLTPKTSTSGSGEVGMLSLRAGGDLSVFGSITDGFAPPPDTPDDDGWVLRSGVQPFSGDVVVPHAGVTLAEGTVYPAGKALNYAITAGNVTLPAGTVLPAALTLDRSLALPAGTVLDADVRAADGSVLLAAGTMVGSAGLTLPAGVQLLAGIRLPVSVTSASLTWPKGAVLPVSMTQLGANALPVGALIVAGTNVVLPSGADSVNLRPADGSGRQARNWAVAQMLPEGSQSWSMSLVAGADTTAADGRIRNTLRSGDLILADTHYVQSRVGGATPAVLNSAGVDAIVAAAGGLPPGMSNADLVGKTKEEIVALYGALSWDDFGLGANFWDASQGFIQLGLTLQGANAVIAAAGGLPPGLNDISELVGKTEPQLITLYMATSWADFGFSTNFWELAQGNGSLPSQTPVAKPAAPIFSVLRTGTGDLHLAAGGNFSMQSPYGVYTAGTQRTLGNATLDAAYNQARGNINSGTVLGTDTGPLAADYERLVAGPGRLYKAWYPDGGGDLRVDVAGNLTGDSWTTGTQSTGGSSSVGNWLWRQGSGGTALAADVPTAWWINFGTYAYQQPLNGAVGLYWPSVVGFTGLGTLGGGNASIRIGGDAGIVSARSTDLVAATQPGRTQGLVLAVGGSGRVLDDGGLKLTGGGDMDVRIGGGWNSHTEGMLTQAGVGIARAHESYGALVNLRGATAISASQIGAIELQYGALQDKRELRAADPYTATTSKAYGGLMLVAGDTGVQVSSRGDLVMGGVANAGLVGTPNGQSFSAAAGSDEYGTTWFNLWTDRTALTLRSAGGNLALDTRATESVLVGSATKWDFNPSGGWFLLPGQVSALAASGSIFYGRSVASQLAEPPANQWNNGGLLLAPLGERRIELLAGGSIYGSGYAISVSGADSSAMASIRRPAFAGLTQAGNEIISNVSMDSGLLDAIHLPLLAFEPNTVAGSAGIAANASAPSRFYALQGDIIGLRSGSVVSYINGVRGGQTDYVGAGPIAVIAGRDIVYTGTRLGDASDYLNGMTRDDMPAMASGNLVVHTNARDVSVIEAGRDILYASFQVAGPGTLEVSAGRNIIQNDKASLNSIGPVVRGDNRPGADIAVQAGLGTMGASYSGLLARYLDAANLAQGGVPLADQPGKVAKTYESELAAWLADRYGFQGRGEEALAYFEALAPEQQRIFARRVYFSELRAAGREYNDAGSPRYGSYLRGRNAIAAMYPGPSYQGELLLYGAAGIHTDIGGNIEVLTPGGGQTFGVEGSSPPASAGLITRGQGDISLYSMQSILLGQSRIMTTFGGNVLAWSAQGDINAGRGAKTTVIYTPPRQIYDGVGLVTISPQTPSTGAGIATLAPIAEVLPGDVDLIAPLGKIDAGEAGIRVSGNINVAALQVVNAANIQTQGKSSGLPVIAAVNIGALTNASAVASNAAMAAQDAAAGSRAAARQNLPSVFTVRVLGFGNEPVSSNERPAAELAAGLRNPGADRQSPVQVIGLGSTVTAAQRARLTEQERRALDAAR